MDGQSNGMRKTWNEYATDHHLFGEFGPQKLVLMSQLRNEVFILPNGPLGTLAVCLLVSI